MPIMIGSARELVHEDNNIAEILLINFFLPLPPYPSSSYTILANQLSITPLTDKEIWKVIILASPHKVSGRDRLLAVIWQYI